MSVRMQFNNVFDSATQANLSINQSQDPSTSTNNLSRRQSLPLLASQHPEQHDAVDQASAVVTLATHGIHVRDFAYETTLPPVTPVPRFMVQTQPRTRLLKRTRDMVEGNEGEESDVEDPTIPRTWYIDASGTGVSRPSRYRKKTLALARTLTEPADEVPASQGFNTREGGFIAPPSESHRPISPTTSRTQGSRDPTTPHKPFRHAQTTSLSPLTITDRVSPSQSSQKRESQEIESWVDTPLVTPNGSLQWPTVQNTSGVPASQLDSILPYTEDDVTLSQLGFSPERSQPRRRTTPFVPSPMGTPSRRRPDPQLPPPAEFRLRTPSPAKSRQESNSPTRRSPRQDHQPPSTRYHLRQRPQGVSANATTSTTSGRGGAARASSRTRTSNQGARKAEPAAAPVRKKQKPSPPADISGRETRYSRRKNGDVESIK
ncbi:hypothetical protein C8Q79DRAFT_944182 [Trametes meyenii]|nr:hypothetical protein C8Q79DRAFT_944182 [Trametes meyenii]